MKTLKGDWKPTVPRKKRAPSHKETEEEIWKKREKRLKELLEKDGGPNPKTKEDFDRLLEEMVRRNSR